MRAEASQAVHEHKTFCVYMCMKYLHTAYMYGMIVCIRFLKDVAASAAHEKSQRKLPQALTSLSVQRPDDAVGEVRVEEMCVCVCVCVCVMGALTWRTSRGGCVCSV